jgi:hypothetical protein
METIRGLEDQCGLLQVCGAKLLVIPSCNCATNPITNPNTAYSHLKRDT